MTLLNDDHFNKEAIKQTMREIWRPVKKIMIKDLGSNLMLAEFKDHRDEVRVMREGPGSFDKHLLLMKELNICQQLNQIKIIEASFWVWIFDLPLQVMNGKVGKLIGEAISIVEEIDVEQGEVAWGEYLRIKVRLCNVRFCCGFFRK